MRLNMRELAEQNTMPRGAKQLAVRSGMVYATMLVVLASLVLVEPIPAHAAKVTISALFGWNARVRASVWCNPNAPPALPNATGTALDFFNIPGAAPNGAPLPPGCTAGTFANGAGGAFWTDASATAAVAGDSADGAPDLLSLLTPVNYKSTSNLTVSGTVLNPFSAMFHVTYSSSDIGSGSLEIWTDYVTGNVLSGADIQIGQSGSFDVTVTDSSGWQYIVLDTEVASRSVPAPEPSALLYLGSGLVGISSWLRRRSIRQG